MAAAYCKYTPFVGNAFQLMNATILKLEPSTGDQILHGLRYQHLTALSEARNPCSDVHSDAFYLIVTQLAFAGVHPYAHRNTNLAEGFPNPATTSNCPGGTIEYRVKSVSG